MNGIVWRQWSRKRNEGETVRECTYIGNRLSACGRCEVAVIDLSLVMLRATVFLYICISSKADVLFTRTI